MVHAGKAHDRSGARFLEKHFGPDLVKPVRLHVAAKRYLCAVERGYFEKLSVASVHSLAQQGGPFSAPEAEAFEAERYHEDAVRLRRWDEQAKVEGMRLPGMEHYRALLDGLLHERR